MRLANMKKPVYIVRTIPFAFTQNTNKFRFVANGIGKQMMVQEMEGTSGIPKTMIHCILTKYRMKRTVAV